MIIEFDFGKRKARRNLKTGLAIGAAAGIAFGAAAGILFAPKSGKETREDLMNCTTDCAKKAAEEIKEAASKIEENAKDMYKQFKEATMKKVAEEEVETPSVEPQEVE
jgi:gas vesicle protein